MAIYRYQARDRSGTSLSGVLAADTPARAREALRRDGVTVMAFQPVRFDRRLLSRAPARSRRQERVAELARHLSVLLRAGVSVVESLDVLIRQPQGRLAPVLRDIREKVAGGAALSEALQTQPQWFDDVFCRAVRVGQLSGHLDRALSELSAHLRERTSLRHRLVSALAYPAILTVLAVGIVLFLMSYVIPQLLAVLEASGRPLPTATVFLKTISDAITGHWMLLMALTATMVAGLAAFYRWTPGRRWLHRLQLGLPVVGGLIRKAVIAQFAQMMSLLLRSGIPFVEALQLVRASSAHQVLRGELEAMESAVRRGSDIAPTLARSAIFPPLVAHLIHVGQHAGELTEMLGQIKEGYETEVRLAVSQATAVLEPLLIVVMSAVVGFVVFATMAPILEATRVIQ
ncbi:MAG: type II secretion system F family protein [Planctomycetes bacterium]|nr:type II secretion system F family protein [Planctomycetota bacterium]